MTFRQAALAWVGAVSFFMLTFSPGEAMAQGAKQKKEAAPDPGRVTTLEQTLAAMKANQDALLARIKELEEKQKKRDQNEQDQELQTLQADAEAEAATGGEVTKQADAEADTESKDFRGGQRALQALNPEISVVGDAYGLAIAKEGATPDRRIARASFSA